MLRAMGLVAQWDGMVAELPAAWPEIGLPLRLARPDDAATRGGAARIAEPGRRRRRAPPARDVTEARPARASSGGCWPGSTSRASRGTLELVAPTRRRQPPRSAPRPRPRPLAAAWDELVAGPPRGLERPAVPRRAPIERRARSRRARARAGQPLAARRTRSASASASRAASATAPRRGWRGAASSASTRRAFPAGLRLLEVFSDTQPVLTQGPTFVVSDRAV